MTIREVNRAIKAWGEREKRRNMFLTSTLYKVPQLISIAIWDGKNYPEIYQAFPDLYDEEEFKKKKQELQTKKDVDIFKAWADSFNKKFTEGSS